MSTENWRNKDRGKKEKLGKNLPHYNFVNYIYIYIYMYNMGWSGIELDLRSEVVV